MTVGTRERHSKTYFLSIKTTRRWRFQDNCCSCL